MAHYLHSVGRSYTLLVFLEAVYGGNVRKYPEMYYLFSMCLMDVGNIISSKKYIKKIVRYNKERKIMKLKEEIDRKYKNLECMECGVDIDNCKLKACGGCGKVVYCSKVCQKKSCNRDKIVHRFNCDGKFKKFCRVRKELKVPTKHRHRMVIPIHNSVYHK